MWLRRPKSLKNLLLIHEIAFLVLVAVTGLIGGLSAYFWQQTSSESVRIDTLAHLNEQIRSNLFRQIQVMIRARVLEEKGAIHEYAAYSRLIDDQFNSLRANAAVLDEDLAIQDLQKAYRVLQRDMNNIFNDPYVTQVARINMLDPRFADQMVDNYESNYQQFRDLLLRRRAELHDVIGLWTRFAPIFIPVPLLLAIFLLLISRRILRRGFVEPMTKIMEGAQIISAGSLQHVIPAEGVEEVSELAQAINRMAQDLATSRNALIATERQAALGMLVPVVAHNIRNPLASIRATAQVLDGVTDAEELRESKQVILDTIDRLGRWVNALVSYLHPLRPNFRKVRASELLSAALHVLKSKVDEKKLRVERRGFENDPLLAADPDLMEQALYALLANAVEASPAGGEIAISIDRADNDNVQIRILDSGPGIPFNPKPGTLVPGPSTKRFGTGLGIPIAYKICQTHGWDLEFNVLAGRGTEVVITAHADRARGNPDE